MFSIVPAEALSTVTAVIVEASRRLIFGLGSLEPAQSSAALRPRRPTFVKRFSGLMRRANSDSSDSGLSSS